MTLKPPFPTQAGRGLAVFANGDVYDGEWRDDHIALTGQGTLTRRDGTTTVFSDFAPD